MCPADPRPLDARRADALGALGAGLDALACQCGLDDCDAADRPAPARNTVIYVITDSTTAQPEAAAEVDAAAPASTVRPLAARPAHAGAAVRRRVLPAVLLDPMLTRAHLRRVVHPGDAPPEDRYTRRAGWLSSCAAAM